MLVSGCSIREVRVSTRMVYKKDWCGDGEDKYTGSALVSMDVVLTNKRERPAESDLRAVITPVMGDPEEKTVSIRPLIIEKGETVVKLSVTVPNVRLWSTWDYGEPNLYELKLSYADAEYACRIGIKEISYDAKHGVWSLNRESVFLRGVTVTGSTARPGAIREAGANMAYVCSRGLGEEFYAECDALGIIVWDAFGIDRQDISFETVSETAEIIRSEALRVCNHASQGMWGLCFADAIYAEENTENANMALCNVIYEALKSVDPVKEVIFPDRFENRAVRIFAAKQMRTQNTRELKLVPNVCNVACFPDLGEDGKDLAEWEAEYLRSRKHDPVGAISVQGADCVNARVLKPILVTFDPGYYTGKNSKSLEVEAGRSFTARIWVINDLHRVIKDVRLHWSLEDAETEEILAGNSFRLDLNSDSAEIPDHVIWPAEQKHKGKKLVLKASVTADEEMLTENRLCITVL